MHSLMMTHAKLLKRYQVLVLYSTVIHYYSTVQYSTVQELCIHTPMHSITLNYAYQVPVVD